MTITILFELIKSLTKEEKRFFKLHSQLQGKHKKYILLFDFLESQTAFRRDLFGVF